MSGQADIGNAHAAVICMTALNGVKAAMDGNCVVADGIGATTMADMKIVGTIVTAMTVAVMTGMMTNLAIIALRDRQKKEIAET